MGIRRYPLAGAAVLLVLAAGVAADEDRFYRWVDEDGVVHYGDRVPPEYAKLQREVINEAGIKIDTLEHEKTADELAAERATAAKAAEAQQRIEAARMRDSVLLTTYLTVDEIEALRDRRAELLDGQIKVTEIYLNNLRAKLAKLQKEAERYRPYSSAPEARPMPESLAEELSDTLDSILLYENTLRDTRQQQNEMVAKFAADIDRFRELKGLN